MSEKSYVPVSFTMGHIKLVLWFFKKMQFDGFDATI